MSLTSLIKDSKSPLAEWFAATFPETRRVGADANQQLRGGPSTTPCVIAPPAGTDHGTVGTAVGYVLNAHLREDGLRDTTASRGAALLSGAIGPHVRDPREVEQEAVERIVALRPWERALARDEWQQLCEMCLVLARLEQYYRAGPNVLPFLVDPLADYGHDVRGLATAFASEVTRSDVDALGLATVEDHLGLRDAKVLRLGPTFAQSLALGGADADIVHDGTLVDLKSTSKPGPVGKSELYQLLGYLLADTDNTYGITRIGFSALRRRRSHYWDASEFLNLLSGPQGAVTLAQARAEFAAVLAPMAEQRASDMRRRLTLRQAGLEA
jgi:hypothetical protein